MKYLTLLFLLSCSLDTPQLKIGDKVKFELNQELIGECSNVGTVYGITHTVTGRVTYTISTLRDYKYRHCPEYLVLFEPQVRKYFTILREDLPNN